MKSFSQLYFDNTHKVAHKWSAYLSQYDRIFSSKRNLPIKLLEIGVQNGGSLEIFSEYFFNAQKIIGIDINPNCRNLKFNNSVISVIVGDVNSNSIKSTLLSSSDGFDFIIDDGSHISGDIIKSFCFYFKNLNEDGIYIVEDLHCSYWKEFNGGLYFPYSSVSFFKKIIDVLNSEHWGIEKDLENFLNGFTNIYGVELDWLVLKQIHSIEFLNSMCIIRKKGAEENTLGVRVISGLEERVSGGHFSLDMGTIQVPSQIDNEWTDIAVAPDEKYIDLLNEVKDLKEQLRSLNKLLTERSQRISELDAFIFDIISSTSWKITAPFRRIVNFIKYFKKAASRI